MNNPLNLGPLSEDEFGRLDEILSLSEDRGLTVEEVDGFFAALVCSPIRVKPGDWMSVVWGGEPPEWATVDESHEATGLLMRMWSQVTESIDDGSFEALMATGTDPDGTEVVLPHAWCMGFVEGMRYHEKYWFDETNQELQELLAPISLIAWDAAIVLGDAPETEERLSEEKLNQCADLLPDAVLALRRYWMEHPVSAGGNAAQVGKNDLCPCGSGKKFMHCHGVEAH